MQSTLPNPQNQPPVNLLPTRPLGVGELIDRSFRLYRRHFRVFLITAAIVILPLALLAAFFTQSALQGQMSMFQTMITEGVEGIESLDEFSTLNSTSAGLQILLSFASMLGYFLTYLALTVLAVRTLRGSEASVSLAWKGAGEFFWPGLRMGILYVLAFMGLTVGVILVVAIFSLVGAGVMGGMLSGLDSNAEGVGAAIGIFFIFCCFVPLFSALIIGPYVYLGARWYVSTPALIDRATGARESLRESWRLTQGNVWRVIGFLLLIYILSVILLALPTYFIQFISLLAMGAQGLWIAAMLSTLLVALLTIVWTPLAAIFPVLLYFDLRLRASGGDIGARVDQLEASVNRPASGTPAYTYDPPPTAIPPAAGPSSAGPSTGTPPAPTASIPSSWDPIPARDDTPDESSQPDWD